MAPGGSTSTGSARRYAGDGFSLSVPATWIDRTVFSFAEPIDRSPRHRLRVTAEPEPRDLGIRDYAGEIARVMAERLSGARVLTEAPIQMAAGIDAMRVVIRWYPLQDQALFEWLLVT